MYPDWYDKISAPFRTEYGRRVLPIIDKGLVYVIAAGYIFTLVSLAASLDGRFFKMLLVPLATFLAVTYLRERLNLPRPYEMYRIEPILKKTTRGKTMPSRHVASAAIISCALMWIHLDWGIVALFATALVAGTRIVGGVHFPRDVVAAIVIGLLFGFIGFVVIP